MCRACIGEEGLRKPIESSRRSNWIAGKEGTRTVRIDSVRTDSYSSRGSLLSPYRTGRVPEQQLQ